MKEKRWMNVPLWNWIDNRLCYKLVDLLHLFLCRTFPECLMISPGRGRVFCFPCHRSNNAPSEIDIHFEGMEINDTANNILIVSSSIKWQFNWFLWLPRFVVYHQRHLWRLNCDSGVTNHSIHWQYFRGHSNLLRFSMCPCSNRLVF